MNDRRPLDYFSDMEDQTQDHAPATIETQKSTTAAIAAKLIRSIEKQTRHLLFDGSQATKLLDYIRKNVSRDDLKKTHPSVRNILKGAQTIARSVPQQSFWDHHETNEITVDATLFVDPDTGKILDAGRTQDPRSDHVTPLTIRFRVTQAHPVWYLVGAVDDAYGTQVSQALVASVSPQIEELQQYFIKHPVKPEFLK